MSVEPTATSQDEPLRVLVLEDNEGDFELLREAVAQQAPGRFDPVQVKTLQEAVEALERGPFDFAVVDLNVPDSSGRQTFERLRSRFPDIPMVVVTGNSDAGLGLQLVLEGAQDYVFKSQLMSDFVTRCFDYAIARKRVENDLRSAQERAEAASEAKSTFLASMSHEIRTPLTAILGMADLLLETELTEEQQSYVHTFQRCGRGLLGILNNVLELSRVESGNIEIHTAEFDLRGMLGDVVEMFGFTAEKKRVGLSLDVDPDVPERVVTDPDRLREVLVNLAGNALKFTESGEIGIRLGRMPDSEDRLRFEVWDTGIGMSEEEATRVFERFTQANTEVGRDYGGSGLGLTICKEVVERLGGSIGLDTRPGVGTTFVFDIRVESATPPPRKSEMLCGKRVLVADDSLTERRILTRMLEAQGADVTVAAGSEEVIAELEQARDAGTLPDIAILDARMPGRGGLDLAMRLCDRPRFVNRVVVMLPMAHRTSDLTHCRKLGVEAVFKPVRESQLLRALIGESPDSEEQRPAEELTDEELQSLRLLLVDDTSENRMLLLAFLRKLGCQVEIAENGEQAVDSFCAGDFDLVLMDMKMPVMDGYEATRRIRLWERENGREPTPIVALTAYAFREEGKHCLDVGCDVHVAKPVDREGLYRTIRRLARPSKIRIRVPDDIADLVPDYLESRQKDVTALQAAVEKEDFATIDRIGHNMKGTGAGYGIDRLSEIGHRIEFAGKNQDAEAVVELTRELAAFLDRVQIVMEPGPPAAGDGGTT